MVSYRLHVIEKPSTNTDIILSNPLYQVRVFTFKRILSDEGDGPERNRRITWNQMISYQKIFRGLKHHLNQYKNTFTNNTRKSCSFRFKYTVMQQEMHWPSDNVVDFMSWEIVSWFTGSLTWVWLYSGGQNSDRRHSSISPPGRWAGIHFSADNYL